VIAGEEVVGVGGAEGDDEDIGEGVNVEVGDIDVGVSEGFEGVVDGLEEPD
jgi:hypothetical protein